MCIWHSCSRGWEVNALLACAWDCPCICNIHMWNKCKCISQCKPFVQRDRIVFLARVLTSVMVIHLICVFLWLRLHLCLYLTCELVWVLCNMTVCSGSTEDSNFVFLFSPLHAPTNVLIQSITHPFIHLSVCLIVCFFVCSFIHTFFVYFSRLQKQLKQERKMTKERKVAEVHLQENGQNHLERKRVKKRLICLHLQRKILNWKGEEMSRTPSRLLVRQINCYWSMERQQFCLLHSSRKYL